MVDLCRLIFGMVIDLLRSRVALEAEILVLRQQINVLRRTRPRRPPFISIDRLILGGVCRLFPKMYDALAIVRPDTVVRWHRAGFRSYWRWKSRPRGGRPTVALEIRDLIREMSIANPLWGAPRIHGHAMPSKADSAVARTIGIDTGKNTLHMVGLNEKGAIVLREKVSRTRIAARFVNLPPCLVGIEAGMASHYVAREADFRRSSAGSIRA